MAHAAEGKDQSPPGGSRLGFIEERHGTGIEDFLGECKLEIVGSLAVKCFVDNEHQLENDSMRDRELVKLLEDYIHWPHHILLLRLSLLQPVQTEVADHRPIASISLQATLAAGVAASAPAPPADAALPTTGAAATANPGALPTEMRTLEPVLYGVAHT